MTIERVWNGYIVECPSLAREVYATLDEVLARALQHFEGRAESFTGASYGRVTIERGKEAPR